METGRRVATSVRTNIQRWWATWLRWLNESPADQPTIFRSARLKLTGFYLAILLALCLTLTLSVRFIAAQEYSHEGLAERGIVRRLLFEQFSVPPTSPDTFNNYQTDQDNAVSRRLDVDIILINLVVLLLGGWLSYWFAGRTLEPIEEAHEAQARFAADASHELKTPLASMKVENEVFLRQKRFTEAEARSLIESNLEEVQRLESLSSNLLALTQYEHTAVRLGAVKAREVVEVATTQMAKQAQAKNIQITSDVQDSTFLGNFDSLVLLMTIVIDNALKYSPRKSTVYVHGTTQGGNYLLGVRDEGPGIAVNDLPLIFDRLFRGDKARSSRISGYGLGLSLAREIVRVNHGTIEAGNYPGGGAVFSMSFELSS